MPFTDIPYQPLPMFTNPPSNVSGTEEFQIGFGSKVLRGDNQGLWLGAKKFVDAPFSVDMLGNIIATTLSLGAYLTKAGSGQVLSGSILVGTGAGGSSVSIDGANNRIIINDGSNPRIVIGNV